MTRASIAVATLAALLAACFAGETPEQRLSGPYILLNAYAGGDTRLAYDLGRGSSIGRVSPVVIGAGADGSHVIVKRHPDGNPSVTEYYIIDRRRDGPHAEPSDCVVGPLDHDGFVAHVRPCAFRPHWTSKVGTEDSGTRSRQSRY